MNEDNPRRGDIPVAPDTANAAAKMPPLQEPRFLNPYADIARHVNRLPHWQQDHATYFVTFRLGDSIPQDKLGQWRKEREAWLRWNPPPWTPKQEHEFHERFSGAFEQWLDALHGSCLLRSAEAAGIVGGALHHFEGQRCIQHAWVVMPNHVHAISSLLGGWRLEKMLHSWKSYSSQEINKLAGRQGELWEKDYFDRMIRNADHFWRCVRYIRRNPEKAKLKPGEFLLFESNYVKSIS